MNTLPKTQPLTGAADTHSDVRAALLHLDSAIGALEKNALGLCERLRPVIRSEPHAETRPAPPDAAFNTPLAEDIAERTRAVLRLGNALEAVNHCLQL